MRTSINISLINLLSVSVSVNETLCIGICVNFYKYFSYKPSLCVCQYEVDTVYRHKCELL